MKEIFFRILISCSYTSWLIVTTAFTSKTISNVPLQRINLSLYASEEQQRRELISLSPGASIVTVKLGNPELARKAWKKRRRSLSPVLIPCSILGIPAGLSSTASEHRMRVLRNNIIYILNRYGKDWDENVGGDGKGGGKGVYLKVSDVNRRYRNVFRGALNVHATELGFENVQDLLSKIIDDKMKREFGVELVESTRPGNDYSVQLLVGTTSRRKARAQALTCGVAEVSYEDGEDLVRHTGRVMVKRPGEGKPDFELLSAALRLSPKDTDKFIEGQEFNAFVFSFDQDGDAGEPLLIMSPEPSREQIREGIKRKQNAKRQMDARNHKIDVESNLLPIEKKLNELSVGDGPYKGRIVHISSRAGAAFLDLGVGRPRSKAKGGGESNAFGMLRLNDWVDYVMDHSDDEIDYFDVDDDDDDYDESGSLEDIFISDSDDTFSFGDKEYDEEEIVEDVTHMFKLSEDGTMYEVDVESKELNELGSIDGEYEGDDDDEDMFSGLDPQERLQAIQNMLAEDEECEKSETGIDTAKVPGTLALGSELNVFISSVSTQSGRFMVTLDSSIQGKKAVDIKREKNAEKRLSKLESSLGERLQKLKGIECEGIVKAKSKTGDWYYVQPTLNDGEMDDLPVGVASFQNDQIEREVFAPGDHVRIRFDGIDNKRGQLALSLLD